MTPSRHSLFCENEFYLYENEKLFPYQRPRELNLVLIQRPAGTRTICGRGSALTSEVGGGGGECKRESLQILDFRRLASLHAWEYKQRSQSRRLRFRTLHLHAKLKEVLDNFCGKPRENLNHGMELCVFVHNSYNLIDVFPL